MKLYIGLDSQKKKILTLQKFEDPPIWTNVQWLFCTRMPYNSGFLFCRMLLNRRASKSWYHGY